MNTHLQNDIDSGQTAPSAEADLHVVEATVALGDVPDLGVTTALGNRILWRPERDVHRRKQDSRRERERERLKEAHTQGEKK